MRAPSGSVRRSTAGAMRSRRGHSHDARTAYCPALMYRASLRSMPSLPFVSLIAVIRMSGVTSSTPYASTGTSAVSSARSGAAASRASAASTAAINRRSVDGSTSGTSPLRIRTNSASPAASRACATASPVPSCSRCTANRTPSPAASRTASAPAPPPTTTTHSSTPAERALSMTCRTIGRPAIACATFGSADRMRVPAPAAITTATHRAVLRRLSVILSAAKRREESRSRIRAPV